MNKISILTITALSLFASEAQAYDKSALAYGLGYVEVFDDVNNAIVGNIEYRSAAYAPEEFFGVSNVSWMAGAEFDTNTSGYVYGGLLYDLPLTDNWSLTPSLAAGLYRQGEGKDLGGSFEFRENLELSYKITPESRAGIAISHKSNASIHDSNPGTETVQLTYSVDLE